MSWLSHSPSYLRNHDTSEIPINWEREDITHFSKGKKKDVENYSPVSLTLVLDKVMEKILPETMLGHIENSVVVGDSQQGFTKCKS